MKSSTNLIHTIARTNYSNMRTYEQSGTLEQLIDAYSYTLEVGQAYQHEKGNRKIDTQPKTIKSLVANLNKSANNAAKNGASMSCYDLKAKVIIN